MRKLAPWVLASLGALAYSPVAFADEPPPKMDMGSGETSGGETTSSGGETTSSGGETTSSGGSTTASEGGEEGDEKKGCAVASTDDALIGAGALVLLVAGAGLRRRESDAGL